MRGVENPSGKVDSQEAHRLMRIAKKDGKKRFRAHQYLEPDQIDNFWSRLNAKRKYGKRSIKDVDEGEVQQLDQDNSLQAHKKLRLDTLVDVEEQAKKLDDFHPLQVIILTCASEISCTCFHYKTLPLNIILLFLDWQDKVLHCKCRPENERDYW